MTPGHYAACLRALGESLNEVAASVLGGPPVSSRGDGGAVTPGHGAYLALVAADEPIQVALLADAAGCQVLAKSLLGMEPADEDLPDGDLSDAMCEIINIVAGGLKRRMVETLPLSLGLPLFVAGPPMPNPHQRLDGLSLELGEVPVELVLLTQIGRAEPRSRRGTAQAVEEKSA